jgi:hypothetical protein
MEVGCRVFDSHLDKFAYNVAKLSFNVHMLIWMWFWNPHFDLDHKWIQWCLWMIFIPLRNEENITFEFIIEIIEANVAYTPFLFCKLVFKFLGFLCLSLHVKCSSTCHPNANLSDPFVLHVLHKGFCNGELIFNSCNWQLAHIPTSLTSEPLILNMMMPQIVASYGLGSNLTMSCCIKF